MSLTAADVQHIERQAQARRALTPDPAVAARLRARQQRSIASEPTHVLQYMAHIDKDAFHELRRRESAHTQPGK